MKRGNPPYENEPVFIREFFDDNSAVEFVYREALTPPRGYPVEPVGDEYADRPFEKACEKRREALFRHCLKNPAPRDKKGHFMELARLHKKKKPVSEVALRAALDYINNRFDCSDFVMLGIVRLLYQFGESPLLSKKLLDEARESLLSFKYWPDEPGIDSMCYWTENHQIMFSANEYLAGQLFPDTVFSNSGMTGMEKMKEARERIVKWYELRYSTGFSEWLSNVYYDEDLTALINLVDFALDPELVRGAEIILDLLFLDMALNSYRGVFGATHGRTYAEEKRNPREEATSATEKLMFGMGNFSLEDNMSAVSLALSGSYRLPRVIYDIAGDLKRGSMINRQRMGIKINEAERWGLDLSNPDDVMILLSLEAYAHPRTFKPVIQLFDRYRWWQNQFFTPLSSMKWLIDILVKTGLHHLVTRIFKKDMTRNTREEVNIYTCKTHDYMVSTAQDYRAGYGGNQQHIWQATLSHKAVIFTTHPAEEEHDSGGSWVGSGTLPRVAQVENLVIAVYNISRMPGIYMTNKLFYTHAWFPVDTFDEVKERDGWIFGRCGDGYGALYSRNSYRWQQMGSDAWKEVIADGKTNIWICEMGRKEIDVTFDDFIEKICAAPLSFKGNSVVYGSPSQGEVRFGWKGKFKQNGKTVQLYDYPRYDNPYVQAEFPPGPITIGIGKEKLELDFEKGVRKATGYC